MDQWEPLRDEARRRRLMELRWKPDPKRRRSWTDPTGETWHEPDAFRWLTQNDDPVHLRF